MFSSRGKASRGVKRLKLKNFTPAAVPASDTAAAHDALVAAITAIYRRAPVETTLETLYKRAETLGLQGDSGRLYGRIRETCAAHAAQQGEMLRRHIGMSGTGFIKELDDVWIKHCDDTMLIRGIFLHLDRGYAHQTAGVEPLWELGLTLFRTNVMVAEIREPALAALLLSFRHDRDGERVDRARIRRLLKMLVDLGLYDEHFETQFLEESKQYFAIESKQRLDSLEPAAYLKYAESRLQEETTRAAQCVSFGTRKPLVTAIEYHLVTEHQTEILRKGLCPLLEGERLEDLARLHRLFDRVEAESKLVSAIRVYTVERGKAVVLDEARDKVMVDELLQLKQRLDAVVEGPFKMSPSFIEIIRSSFETAINARPNKPAEMIAKFLDGKLRTGYKECTEEALEALFDRVMVLFRFLNGKDVFEAYYKRHLARRLLLQKSASDDAERSVLGKLKQECGAAYTSQLEGMFKDVGLSLELSATFQQTARKKCSSNIDMSVNVLTASHWPSFTPLQLGLPSEVVELQNTFAQFYCSKHGNRKLTWECSLGHCLIGAKFPKGDKDLHVSIYQGLVLLAFNSSDRLTCAEIQRLLNLEPGELTRALQSLACGRVRVLKKTPRGKEVLPTDVFEINDSFENKHKRVKINQIQLKETPRESEVTQEKVFQERVFAVDAAIVRIMKSRKQIAHTALITTLFEQLKFPVKPADLKKRIENLIERDYMARDPSDATIYRYVA